MGSFVVCVRGTEDVAGEGVVGVVIEEDIRENIAGHSLLRVVKEKNPR